MTAGIYRIRNRVTGVAYVGSSVDVEYRAKGHVGRLTLGTHDNRNLQAAWISDGPKAFAFGILERTPKTYEALADAEARWLSILTERGGVYNIRRSTKRPPTPLPRVPVPKSQCEVITAKGRCLRLVFGAPGACNLHRTIQRRSLEPKPKRRRLPEAAS